MEAGHLSHFIACIPAIRARWSQGLEPEPADTPLGRADTRGFLIEATLMAVISGLERGADAKWMAAIPATVGAVHAHCACAAGPIQRYFAAGEAAVRHVLGGDDTATSRAAREILARLRAHELGLLCGACPHPFWSRCGLLPPPNHADFPP